MLDLAVSCTPSGQSMQYTIPNVASLVLAVALCTWTAPASADAPLQAGLQFAAEGELESALESFESALSQGVSRSELVQLLTERALVYFALGAEAAMERDLSLLAALEPGLDLSRRAAPPVREAFDALCAAQPAAIEVALSAHSVVGGLRLDVKTQYLPAGLDARIELSVRRTGAAWTRVSSDSFVYPIVGEGEIEYYVSLLGPGNAVLAAVGSEQRPQVYELEGALPVVDVEPEGVPPAAPESRRSKKLWWWVGASGVAVAAASLAVALSVSGGGDSTTAVGGPRVVGSQ